jgi:hypothetical protein
MSIDFVEIKSSTTYDAPVLQDTTRLINLYAGYGNALRAQNRTCLLVFTDTPYLNVSEIQLSGRYVPWEYFELPLSSKLMAKETVITIAQARNIAITALLEAEKRRQEESEREAMFWKYLDGEE